MRFKQAISENPSFPENDEESSTTSHDEKRVDNSLTPQKQVMALRNPAVQAHHHQPNSYGYQATYNQQQLQHPLGHYAPAFPPPWGRPPSEVYAQYGRIDGNQFQPTGPQPLQYGHTA